VFESEVLKLSIGQPPVGWSGLDHSSRKVAIGIYLMVVAGATIAYDPVRDHTDSYGYPYLG
jgi:hypothetical protein